MSLISRQLGSRRQFSILCSFLLESSLLYKLSLFKTFLYTGCRRRACHVWVGYLVRYRCYLCISCLRVTMLTSRLARGAVASESGRRVYQLPGFVCKQMHVPGQSKPIPTMAGFPPPAWRIQSIRRRSDKKSKSIGATHQRGRRHLSKLYFLHVFLDIPSIYLLI